MISQKSATLFFFFFVMARYCLDRLFIYKCDFQRHTHTHTHALTRSHTYEKTKFYSSQFTINPYKPGVPFVVHRRTVQTLIRHRIMRRLIKVFTVCLQKFQLQTEQKWKIYLTSLKWQMDLPSIMMGKFIRLIRVKKNAFLMSISRPFYIFCIVS